MTNIRVLQIIFDAEVAAYEIPQFRAAIAEKVGREHILFHNHLDDEKYLHKYPVIQYKSIRNNPSIMSINEGIEEIHNLFANSDWEISIGNRKTNLKIKKLSVNKYTMQAWDKMFDYSLINWLALNEKNYKTYFSLQSLADKVQLLEKILTANLISFAKGINWLIDKDIEVKIRDIRRQKLMTYKNMRLTGFDIEFSTNVFLPNYIGIGKGVSKGFGTVKMLKNGR